MRATMRTMEPGTFEQVRERLQQEVDERGGNKRRLAREIAAADGTTVEAARRAIYRVLHDGSLPDEETSAMFERGLGKPAGYFTVAPEARASRRDRLESLEAEARDRLRLIRELLKTVGELGDRIAAVDGQAPPKVPRLSGRR